MIRRLLLIALLVSSSLSIKLRDHVSLSNHGLTEGLYNTEYVDVKLDNFDYTNTKTFKLKYLINDTYFEPGGPLFFYTGNEGSIEGFAQNTGIMYSMAKPFKALLVFAEHRYYGLESSKPFGNGSFDSAEHAKYLTADQALADYAVFILDLKAKHNITKAIAFGGSYGGMLSAWLREKYPHVVDGAWASSAPLAYFKTGDVDPGAYYRKITESAEKFGCDFNTTVRAFEAIENLPYDTLNKIFNIPEVSKLKSNSEYYWVMYYVRTMFEAVTMTCYPYPAHFLADLDSWPLSIACAPLSQTNLTTDEEYAQALYDSVRKVYKNDVSCVKPAVCSDPFSQSLGDLDGWYWQTCTQIAMPIWAQGPPNDFFWDDVGNMTSDEFLSYQCKGLKVPGYSTDFLDIDGVKKVYGFNAHDTSNVILTQGLLDPWSVGGPHVSPQGLKNQLFVYLIEGSAHHLDLRTPNTCDPESVVAARKQIYHILQCWTGQAPDSLSCDPERLHKSLPDFDDYSTQKECKDILDYNWNSSALTSASFLTILTLFIFLKL